MSKQEKQIEEMRTSFMAGIQAKAREYADLQNSIPILEHHMVAAIVDRMASAFVFNVKTSAEINALKADIEALRRAVVGDGNDYKN